MRTFAGMREDNGGLPICKWSQAEEGRLFFRFNELLVQIMAHNRTGASTPAKDRAECKAIFEEIMKEASA